MNGLHRRRTLAAFAGFTLWLLLAATVQAGSPAAWEVRGDRGTLVLLGSVHLLPEHMAALPEPVERLYERADTLVMELDLAELDPAALQQELSRMGLAGEGPGLRERLGEARWERAQAMAGEFGLNLALFDPLKPWLAALTVTQMRLLQLGLAAEHGLDMQLAVRAGTDGKPVTGLETAAEQLGLFDRLPDEEQIGLLLQSLEEAVTLEDDLHRMLEAWQQGDTAYLESELLDGLREQPRLYDSVVVQRNRHWVAPLEAQLGEPGTHLVVVGALHLVGEHSVVALLRERGHDVHRLD